MKIYNLMLLFIVVACSNESNNLDSKFKNFDDFQNNINIPVEINSPIAQKYIELFNRQNFQRETKNTDSLKKENISFNSKGMLIRGDKPTEFTLFSFDKNKFTMKFLEQVDENTYIDIYSGFEIKNDELIVYSYKGEEPSKTNGSSSEEILAKLKEYFSISNIDWNGKSEVEATRK